MLLLDKLEAEAIKLYLYDIQTTQSQKYRMYYIYYIYLKHTFNNKHNTKYTWFELFSMLYESAKYNLHAFF